ncbi:MAG TPA: hypothetical protein VH280_16630 [Verrucomicrobiae bacterium]|jgi:hypothetical protein|nr:hypothetical protein [Verrucomicrobiae bacterium]
MKPKTFLCFTVILAGILAGCTTASHYAKSETNVEHVKFIASLPKQNAAGQPIYLRLRIENDRSNDIAVEWWDRSTSITIKNARGGIVPRTTFETDTFISPKSCTTALLQHGMPQPHGILHPHHSYETSVDLNQYFQLKPGTYLLAVSIDAWAGQNYLHVLKLQAKPISFAIGNDP